MASRSSAGPALPWGKRVTEYSNAVEATTIQRSRGSHKAWPEERASNRGGKRFRRGGSEMKTKAEVLAELASMLSDVFVAKEAGEAYGRLARAHGYVDGYMRALLDLEFVTKGELLEIVNAQREH